MNLLVLLAACSPNVIGGEFRPGEVPGTGTVTFDAEAGTRVHVRYGPGDRLTERSPSVPAEAGEVALRGLKLGARYTFEAVAEGPRRVDRSDRFEASIPMPDAGVPSMELDGGPADGTCGSDGYVLFTWNDGATSGVAIVDRDGDLVWALPQKDPAVAVVRARPGRDGDSLLWSEVARDVRNGSTGRVVRTGMDGDTRSETLTLDPHHDFVERVDGRIAWLAYEFSQPSDGATLQPRVTDRIDMAAEGAASRDEVEVVFSTLADYPLGSTHVPPEGADGASLPGFNEWGHAASLGQLDDDGSLFLMWRWLDTLLRLDDDGGLVWQWGGEETDLSGPDSFSHAHFSDVWEDGVLVFDNGLPEDRASRLVEYAYNDDGFEVVWELEGSTWEPGIGDLRRIPGCDNLLASWPSTGRIAEIARDGTTVWEVTSDVPIGRVEYLSSLRDFTPTR